MLINLLPGGRQKQQQPYGGVTIRLCIQIVYEVTKQHCTGKMEKKIINWCTKLPLDITRT